jgi:hypothetical protein
VGTWFLSWGNAFGRWEGGVVNLAPSQPSSVVISNVRSDTPNPLIYFQGTDRAKFLNFVFFTPSNYVLRVAIRTRICYSIQLLLIGCYKRDGVCLLRSTN